MHYLSIVVLLALAGAAHAHQGVCSTSLNKCAAAGYAPQNPPLPAGQYGRYAFCLSPGFVSAQYVFAADQCTEETIK